MHNNVVPEIRTRDLCTIHDFAITPYNAVVDAGVGSHLSAGADDNIADVAALGQLHAFFQIDARSRKRVPVGVFRRTKRQLQTSRLRLGCHASARGVESREAVGIGNNRVRPSGGDILADAVVGRHALHPASILSLNHVGKQLVPLHVVDKSAADKVVPHVVPIHFFAERGKDLGGAKTHMAIHNVVSANKRNFVMKNAGRCSAS